MHSKNLHREGYNFKQLKESHPPLEAFMETKYEKQTINFSDPNAVFELNKALLKHHYKISYWEVPEGFLTPPIPSRADYIHYLEDILPKSIKMRKGLDIGVGANCIYPILGVSIYGWNMVGSEIDETAANAAQEIVKKNKLTKGKIDIRYQKNNADLFNGIIKENEYYDFTMCNPPFYTSEEEAKRATFKKNQNLNIPNPSWKNFKGTSHELWCNGGEALFIKRLIKQSISFKDQVGVFTTLVSRKEHLPKIKKQLDKLKATYQVVEMESGQKKSRFIAWKI